MTYKKIELPNGLRPLTEKFIKGIINTFDKEDKLNSLDNLSLYLLANNVNTYLDCEEHIAENGYTITSDRGNESLSGYVVLQKQVQSSITVLLKELGLTLGSRDKLKLIQNVTEESPLMQFINDSKKI